MKHILALMIVFGGLTIPAVAQTKAVQTAKIQTPGILCAECEKRITTYLDRYDGIMSTKVNYRKGELTVKYITERINIEEIKAAIANAGYDADDVKAEEGAYKRLPKTCKKPEDGGGHPVLKTKPAEPVQQP